MEENDSKSFEPSPPMISYDDGEEGTSQEESSSENAREPTLTDQLTAMGYGRFLKFHSDNVPLIRRLFKDLVSVTKRFEVRAERTRDIARRSPRFFFSIVTYVLNS